MNRGIWIMAGMGLAGLVVLAFLGQAYLGSTSGLDETVELQSTLRGAYGILFEPEPPLRVMRVPGEGGGERKTWRWKVEATLRPGMDPALPPAAGSLVRIVNRCAAMQIPGKAFTGVILVLHRPGAPDWTREYGMDGVPRSPPKAPAPASEEPAEGAK
jgi:hypothetical protein